MGRRPNSLILRYFERGPKLADNSNRYPHTCRACGENFPKGRIDSLANHLTKKCPAITEADRIHACLTLHGIGTAAQQGKKSQAARNGSGPQSDPSVAQRDWTALETLAEVSRQIEANEKHDDRGPAGNGGPATPPTAASQNGADRLDTEEQYADNSRHEQRPNEQQPNSGYKTPPSAEPNLQELIQSATDSANLSMAAAATARLNPALLDPQLLEDGNNPNPSTPAPAPPPASAAAPRQEQQQATNGDTAPAAALQAATSSQPWGEITYLSEGFQPGPHAGDALARTAAALAKSTFRMPTATSLGGGRPRHSRARFDATRRKEVQEVRKIGACIRCRILRKTCSKGQPCDTCRKVLSPRIWRSGCVRTKVSEQLDLYSAGVQIVLAQHRINSLKSTMSLASHGLAIEASHFPDKPVRLLFHVLQKTPVPAPAPAPAPDTGGAGPLPPGNDDNHAAGAVVMIDNDTQDVPSGIEAYMRQVLPEFVQREPSEFMRVTLETALGLAAEKNDELLKKALELWGLVEILDRERQWHVRVRPSMEAANGSSSGTETEDASSWIHFKTEDDVFTTICLQLSAAAERKAAATSKGLLTGMQRALQDSKTKVDYSMYFATLILLNCVEKSTWAFKAWEQDSLRAMWPLEKEPGSFTQQGYVIANLLRMLLAIRKALPRTALSDADGLLVTLEPDPLLQTYFAKVGLNYSEVQSKQEHPVFSPTDPRSFELLFCSTLLLPGKD